MLTQGAERMAEPRYSFSEAITDFSGKVEKLPNGWKIPGAVLLSEWSRNVGPNGKPRHYSEAEQKKARSRESREMIIFQ